MIPKTYDEAKKQVLELYREYLRIRAESNTNDSILVGNEEAKRAYDKIDRYNLALYSLPWLKPRMKAWMVDVKFGDENPFSQFKCFSENFTESEASDALDLLNNKPEEFTEKISGSLGKIVSDYITNELGLRITDRGGGTCGGHIGCPCTDYEMEYMINSLNVKFKSAIAAGLMAVKIAWFKPTIYGNDDNMDSALESDN